MPLLAKLTSKNQLTLPKAITQAVGPASYFEVQAKAGQIVLTPVRIQRGDAVRAQLTALGLAENEAENAVSWARGEKTLQQAAKPSAQKRETKKTVSPKPLAEKKGVKKTVTAKAVAKKLPAKKVPVKTGVAEKRVAKAPSRTPIATVTPTARKKSASKS